MDQTYATSLPHEATSQSRTLAVDFTWRKLKTLITDTNESNPTPLYTVDCNIITNNLTFKTPQNDQIIGTGSAHAISISPDYQLHGVKGTLKAQKRLRTVYTHVSTTFSTTGAPAKMTWTSKSGFKTWDFICVDEQQQPVARFSANMWALKKVGKIELLGPKALDDAARDEIVVVGFTLYYCWILRVNNPFNLLGSAFLSKEKPEKVDKLEGFEKVTPLPVEQRQANVIN
ncbi:uncharacterized protein N7496_008316 [Penicillium cataractarum]|uniref:Uncharacterized protein n=1 Tax=Penicillium cataractarum TaxID=2100454 RepID=A0A9W9RYI6_9EURO|nr:uncharacterized protein N7496_008316 [Penicillium cataractarum]KAJ5368556.1 hypothetical protein N7496_008316 [Penicillium cataractarum]